MDVPALERDRDYRRQVRRAYYLLPEDFATPREYNDYLEEVEDLVEAFMSDRTRPDARKRLDELRSMCAPQTARNLAKYDAARMQREDAIEQDRQLQLRAAQERREAELAQQRAKLDKRNALQQAISTGNTSVEQARADQRAEQFFVQPIDEKQAAAVVARQPKFMVRSLLASTEAYEANPAALQLVRKASGYEPDLWRIRYRIEAGLRPHPESVGAAPDSFWRPSPHGGAWLPVA